jgi:acyl carrier protein
VPSGVPGELYIGGLNVARGYLHKPGLTAERFVPNPYTTRPGERLYRTGDLAKYLPDGAIEFLGRADEQVKIRGYRVELGEVEAALLRHPALQTVAAVAWAESAMTRRLVAYVVPKPGVDSPAASELKLFLKQTLPEFMLPSAFVFLDQLPLTASGKVARRLLPPPDRDAAHTENFVLPRTPIEEQVAAIWCSLLEIKQVSIHDDFFGLGGHSLIATQLVARLNEAFDLELPVRTIFDRPTIAELSAIIVEKRSEAADEALLAQMLSDLENLSDDEARTRLNKLAP